MKIVKKNKKKPRNTCENSKDVLNLQPQNRTRFLRVLKGIGEVPEW
jgi:hypothetical protein